MQVFGLPGQIIRNGRAASRLLDAKTPNIEAARRRDAVARWRRAIADGLTTVEAAKAVGAPRSSLYRWERNAEPKRRRPLRVRQKDWPPALRRAVERLRQDFPMWGKARLGPLVRVEGFAASDSKVGRILADLAARGLIQSVPSLRRRPDARRWTAKRRFARPLPRGLCAAEPGGLIQIDTVYVNLSPTKAIKHFAAYDPVAKWTVGKAFNRATAQAAASFLDKVTADMPFPIKAIQVDGGSEFMAQFEQACDDKGLALYVLPPRSPQMTEPSNAAMAHGDTSSTKPMNSPAASRNSTQSSTPSSTSITTTGPTEPLQDKPQPSISQDAQPKTPPRLICPDPGQTIDASPVLRYDSAPSNDTRPGI